MVSLPRGYMVNITCTYIVSNTILQTIHFSENGISMSNF